MLRNYCIMGNFSNEELGHSAEPLEVELCAMELYLRLRRVDLRVV